MEEMASLWCYQENIYELKDRLLYTSLELESLKIEAIEELGKNNEKMKQLINALNLAYKERDEAISQYHTLLILNKIHEDPVIDHPDDSSSSIIIDNFVKGKDLPQKGMLLKAVLDAGPLLQTVLVAGPLPQWRNPPPVLTFPVPPVGFKDPGPGSSFVEMSCSSAGSCLVGGGKWVAANCDNNVNGYCQIGKRQRIR
ncbi:uncharacterized protein LOC124922435 [Impatiens glandulifera]|uniref:uncharacterized protein LOC124922435 n=1 Tax=Impatiens glandulifera TaxID=253017 RepID=UPI001FB08933|nr:uncharacterized protein LOC124922435 [Impatiens glandulifera]